MKKAFTLLIATIIALCIPIQTAYAKEEKINCKASILMCLNTGDIILEENSYEQLYPASVTKIMSILLILEAIDSGQIALSDKVTATENAVSKGGSQIWLEVGEQMTVEELLKAVIISSANDACTLLGEYIAGSSDAFVDKMNERCKDLGLENSHFENCTGLDDDATNHYSCAYDLAVIAREVMKHELITKYSTVWLDSLRNGKTELNNTNKLINSFEGITGLKTGTTSKAGFCLCATAERDGLSFVSVVLGANTSDDRFNLSSQLLEYGFVNYKLEKIELDNNMLKEIKVKNGIVKSVYPRIEETQSILLKKEVNNITYDYNFLESVEAPINTNKIVGELVLKCDEEEIMSIPFKSDKTVKRITIKYIFVHLLNKY